MLCVAVGLLRSAVLVLAAGPLLVGESLSPWEFTLVAAVGVLHVEVGLRTWRARGDNRTGPLMIVSGLMWLMNAWGRAAFPAVFAEGVLLSACYDPILLHCSLIIPTGRLRQRRDLILATLGYLYWPGFIAATWLARGTRLPSVADLVTSRALTYPLIGIGLFAFFVARYRAGSAGRPTRRAAPCRPGMASAPPTADAQRPVGTDGGRSPIGPYLSGTSQGRAVPAGCSTGWADHRRPRA